MKFLLVLIAALAVANADTTKWSQIRIKFGFSGILENIDVFWQVNETLTLALESNWVQVNSANDLGLTTVCVSQEDVRVCPLYDANGFVAGMQLAHRTSFSRMCLGDNSLYATGPNYPVVRPRQNSVFVGSTTTMAFIPENAPRKSKSAMDIQSLVMAESASDSRDPRCPRIMTRSHSPTVGFVPGNSLGVSCVGYTSPYGNHAHSPSLGTMRGNSPSLCTMRGNSPSLNAMRGNSPSLTAMRGNSLGGFGTPGRLGLLTASSTGRLHRNSICNMPSTSKGNYLTVTNV